ncbi:unnamed protein product [Spirodela intermedia]|uniref:Uncharacterized protein n=1 Tax=Spirodela intermedia TaxID=51605 RepID=A0ABN7EA62_SPIIN|nr:unnamed protein product [Spirodela intermedia]
MPSSRPAPAASGRLDGPEWGPAADEALCTHDREVRPIERTRPVWARDGEHADVVGERARHGGT